METEAYAATFHNETSYWWYVARREILMRMVRQAAGERTDMEVLNLGCGTGVISESLQRMGRVVSADASETALEFCRARGLPNLVRCEATSLPFADGTFDLVGAFDLLEHVEDDGAALAEIRRVMRPGGVAVFSVPAYRALWSPMDVLARHVRRYRRRDLCRRIRTAGFEIRRATYFNTLLFPLAVLERIRERLVHAPPTPETVLVPVPGWLNAVLAGVFRLEAVWLPRAGFPFGLSVLAVAAAARPAGEAPVRS